MASDDKFIAIPCAEGLSYSTVSSVLTEKTIKSDSKSVSESSSSSSSPSTENLPSVTQSAIHLSHKNGDQKSPVESGDSTTSWETLDLSVTDRIPDGQADSDLHNSCRGFKSPEYDDCFFSKFSDNVEECTPSISFTQSGEYESDFEDESTSKETRSKSGTLSTALGMRNFNEGRGSAVGAENKGKICPKTAKDRSTQKDSKLHPDSEPGRNKKGHPDGKSRTSKVKPRSSDFKNDQKQQKTTGNGTDSKSPRHGTGKWKHFFKSQNSPRNKNLKNDRAKKRNFNSRIGSQLFNLIEDVVTQMSLLADDNDCCPEKLDPSMTRKSGLTFRSRKSSRGNRRIQSRTNSRKSSVATNYSLKSGGGSGKNEGDKLSKWGINYMKGLNMYRVDQVREFDKIHAKGCSSAKNTSKPSQKGFKVDPHCHTCEKKSIRIQKLKTSWSKQQTTSKSGHVLPKLLVPRSHVPSLGDTKQNGRLKKDVNKRMRVLHLPPGSINVLGASDVKLVSQSRKLIVIGEGSTSLSVLGHLVSEGVFVVVKMFKMPFAGGKTSELIDQSLLASHVNKTMVVPKFYGLVALDTSEDSASLIHNVAMVFKFIGHTPSCVVTTLSSLCENASTSTMYRDPAADTRICRLNVANIVHKIVLSMIKVHEENVVLPGLDSHKILLCEEEGFTRPFLLSRLHPMKDHSLAMPMLAYLGLKKSKSSSYSLRKEPEVPPESTRRGFYSIQSDVFQLGKILLLVGQAFNITSFQYLARRCLRQDPLNRPLFPKILHEVGKIVAEYEPIVQS